MENLYVTFGIVVSDVEYSYRGSHGDAEIKMQVPRSVLRSIDAGDLFHGILMAALANFDSAVEGEPEQ